MASRPARAASGLIFSPTMSTSWMRPEIRNRGCCPGSFGRPADPSAVAQEVRCRSSAAAAPPGRAEAPMRSAAFPCRGDEFEEVAPHRQRIWSRYGIVTTPSVAQRPLPWNAAWGSSSASAGPSAPSRRLPRADQREARPQLLEEVGGLVAAPGPQQPAPRSLSAAVGPGRCRCAASHARRSRTSATASRCSASSSSRFSAKVGLQTKSG